MGSAKKAFVLSVDDGPIDQAPLMGRIERTAEGGISVAYDLPDTPDARSFLGGVIGTSPRFLDRQISEFTESLDVTAEMAGMLSAHLEALDRLKRNGFVGEIHPIGMEKGLANAREVSDLEYWSHSERMRSLQEQFMGKVLLSVDFEELKGMMYALYGRFKVLFSAREQGIASNASELIGSGERSSYVVVMLPLYVKPVAQDLRSAGIGTDRIGTVHGREIRWQTEVLADALRQMELSDVLGEGRLSSGASLSLTRYTLMRAIGSLNSIKEYFYSLRFRHHSALTDEEKRAVRNVKSDEQASRYYAERQAEQWKGFRDDLPGMKQFLRKEEYRRVERIATRMRSAA
ncbi:MAG: hypothetical protein KGH69_04955 [Candidatus Micrarchaeota archaeon]|nr:hypothetical protein [Candidatus Micrarchaeota archaeon]